MTEEEKKQLVDEVTKEIAGIYKLNGLDFFALSAKETDVVIQVFQFGVGFIENKKAKFISEGIEKLNNGEIPF